MWEEIIFALGPSVLDAVGGKFFEIKEKKQVQKRLETIIKKEFKSLKGTTLDCEEFYNIIHCDKFTELMRNYFFMINDGLEKTQYIDNVLEYICGECSQISIVEARMFLEKIEEFYIEYLHKIIESYPEIFAAFQLMSLSHRELISKVRDSKNELLRYLETLENRAVVFDDENIALYHNTCEREYGIIRFTGISGAERRQEQNLNDFYVRNSFSYYGKEIDKLYRYRLEDIRAIELENFFDFGNKIVLVGGAGLGKSTTLNYLFCNYESLYGVTALKLKIDLKEYAKDIGEKKRSLLWCITNEFSKRIRQTNLSFEDLQSIVASNLNKGKCLVILDALDEIPTQPIRNKVRDEIANFSAIYYLNRFVISTREVGYLRNRFNDTFLHIRINQFNSSQIKKYSRNWYLSYYEELDNFDEFWEKFKIETERARCENLIRNPIILILALVIFDVGKNLPTKRIEFYQKCIETFLTERENRKAAIVLGEKTKSILAMNLTVPKIAHYKFERIKNNVGYKFSYKELNNAVMNSIDVSDEINWITAVKEYSEYLVERTELIKEVDEETLDFAHKTFYEYFLAFYFSKVLESKDLVNLLKNWIGDSNYDELARLIVEIVIQNNDPKQHNYVIESLFEMLFEEKKKHTSSPSKTDVFSLISDLYNHNMLQPKYHHKYNSFIILNPVYVERLHRNLNPRGRVMNQTVQYDTIALSKIFWENACDGNLIKILDSLYYLNNDFKRQVSSYDQEGHIYHIEKLFSFIRENRPGKTNPDLYISELKYFLSDGIELTMLYPQIFISVVSLSLAANYDNVKELLNYCFEPNDNFYTYSNPIMLFDFIKKAKISNEYFVLLLICFIDCIDKSTNSIFDFIFNRSINSENKKLNEEVAFCVNIWKMLNESNLYEEFRDELIRTGRFISDYDNLYCRLFNNYLTNSKNIDDNRIKKFIHNYNINVQNDN